MTWGYMVMEALYVVGLLSLISLSLVALLKKNVWISVFEATLLFGVCVSAITLFESPPRPGVVGLVVCASLLCLSAYRRWRKLEAERKAAALAAAQAASAAEQAASAATIAAEAATQSATDAAQAATAQAATVAADAATEAAANANEAAITAAAKAARELAAAKAARKYGDEAGTL